MLFSFIFPPSIGVPARLRAILRILFTRGNTKIERRSGEPVGERLLDWFLRNRERLPAVYIPSIFLYIFHHYKSNMAISVSSGIFSSLAAGARSSFEVKSSLITYNVAFWQLSLIFGKHVFCRMNNYSGWNALS